MYWVTWDGQKRMKLDCDFTHNLIYSRVQRWMLMRLYGSSDVSGGGAG